VHSVAMDQCEATQTVSKPYLHYARPSEYEVISGCCRSVTYISINATNKSVEHLLPSRSLAAEDGNMIMF
jgi:hypothetical protein